MTVALLTIVAVAVLAFANGANDVSKGIATLAGSGRTTYRLALAWGTLWTAAGACAAVLISFGLVKAFTSALVAADVLALASFPLAVAAAASVWVLFASVTGLPVSTTHALTGALVGAALSAGGSGAVNWWLVLSSVAAPLALSPLASAACGYGLHGVARRIERACVCADTAVTVAVVNPDCTLTAAPGQHLVASVEGCEAAPGRVRLVAGHLTHWGAAAAASFARALNDSPKIAALGIVTFASVDGGVVAAFAATAAAMTRMLEIRRGQRIYLAGDPSDQIFLLKVGVVRISVPTGAQDERILAFLYPGDVFGELAVVEEAPRGHVATAHEDVVLCAMGSDILLRLIQEAPALGYQITKLMGLRLRRFQTRIEELLFKSAHARVAHALLDMAADYGIKDNQGVLIPIRLNQRDLGNLVGLARETVNVVLHDFKERGLIDATRRNIRITDPSRLRMVS